MSDLKAFKVTIGDVESVVFCRSRGQAKYLTLLSAKDCGYELKFIDVKAKRIKHYENVTDHLLENNVYPLSYVASFFNMCGG